MFSADYNSGLFIEVVFHQCGRYIQGDLS